MELSTREIQTHATRPPTRGALLLGLGTSVPDHYMTQPDVADFMSRVLNTSVPEEDRERLLGFIERVYANSGIDKRHCIVEDYVRKDPAEFDFFPNDWSLEPQPLTGARMEIYEREAVALAEPAARQAIAQAGIEPHEITHLLICSSTGFFSPGPDVMLAKRLGIPATVRRSVLGFMGCFLAFQGITAADNIIRANPNALVLQVNIDLCSLHFQKSPDPATIVVNSLFADGCSVAVYGGTGVQDGPHPARPVGEVLTTASLADIDNLGKMTWKIGDTGFKMYLSSEVPSLLGESVGEFVDSMLADVGLRRTDVNGWVIHPGGRKIVEVVRDSLKLDQHDVASAFEILRTRGNMSCPTVMFVLEEHLRTNHEPGPTVALGFGPGLGIEGAVIDQWLQ